MPEYDALGNPKLQPEDEAPSFLQDKITVSINGVEICTAENVNISLEDEIIKLKEEQKRLIDSIKNGCEISGTYKKRGRNRKKKEKLPKKLRNGWS